MDITEHAMTYCHPDAGRHDHVHGDEHELSAPERDVDDVAAALDALAVEYATLPAWLRPDESTAIAVSDAIRRATKAGYTVEIDGEPGDGVAHVGVFDPIRYDWHDVVSVFQAEHDDAAEALVTVLLGLLDGELIDPAATERAA